MIANAREWWRTGAETVAWLVAAAWVFRASDVVRNLPAMPRLTGVEWDRLPERVASLMVVVPARNEEANIAATLDALMVADYPALKVLVIDDRSTDKTGMIVDAYVAEYATRAPGRLDVIHVTDLPEGWLGKTFALQVGTENSESEFLLFTDADVLFSPSVLRRTMVYMEAERADHAVVLPTMQVKSWGEGVVLGFFQILGMWAARPWRVSDPKAYDTVGVGAFNLIRRTALEETGGWTPQRMAILEDITIGRRMKLAGMRQRLVFAPGLVLVHWASGGFGLVRVMTKNLFSAFNFRPLLLLVAALWMTLFFLAPLAEMGWWPTVGAGVMVLCSIGALYRVVGEVSEIDARYGWLFPLGALAFMWAMVRSMAVVWWRGGVEWRGTHYALRDLRRHNSQLKWIREAAEERRAAKIRL
ncbi:glycosyltransferase [Granulicella sp. 5B5]|uniref:glycosyltransferase n=1 Tax=Granulicella sp. 5B5 TaxID=1617967 RepID=UPI0015F46572|nr:glycosyltransferase [Granulicella sp. 5B5]QMV19542.1 glycosyltransferase [Granulicella sp. 5B5]